MDFIWIKGKTHNKEDFGAVYARVRSDGNNKKYSTGFSIKEHEWLKYRSLQYSSSALMTSIGIKYGQFASILAQIKAALEDNFDPDKASAVIRSIKAGVLNGEEFDVKVAVPGNKIPFVSFMQGYIDDLRSGKRTKKGRSKNVSAGYIANMASLLNIIKKYETERRKNLSLDDITMKFQQDFVRWNLVKGSSTNTIYHKMSGIRTVMVAAYEDKKTKCDDFRRSDFVPKQEEVDHVYLTPKMIQDMLDLDLSTREAVRELIAKSNIKAKQREVLIRKISIRTCWALEESRDVFIVGCLTGQRVSDYSRFSKDMITVLNGRQFLKIVQAKTGKLVYIPMDTRVSAILDKYDGILPEIDYKKIIRHVKFIGELMHWTYKADIDPSMLGSKKKNRFCDLLGTHTARRSFATNAYAAGVPLSSIMAVTGHGTEQILRKYLKLQDKEKAIIAANDFAGVIKTE